MSDFDSGVLATELHSALRASTTLPLISERHPDFSVEDAYAVSQQVLRKRLDEGERLVGKKIGLTSKAVQEALGIDEPDFGFLTDAMEVPNGAEVSTSVGYNTPMIEAEIAIVLKTGLPAANVTAEDVLAATDYAVPCLEIVDTRFNTPRLKIVDTVADNASSAFYVIGEGRVDPRQTDLAQVSCTLTKNGEVISEGLGAAVIGSPLNSVAWLANRLGSSGVTLDAGDVILAGSLVPFAPIAAGDSFEADFPGMGSVSVSFS